MKNVSSNHALLQTPGKVLRLQSTRLMPAVAELWSLGIVCT